MGTSISLKTLLATAAFALLSPATVFAHATLEVTEAAAGASYKGVVRIGHGCEGTATLKVRVRIPEGMIGVKPVPKAGWTLETVKVPFKEPVKYLHGTLTEGVREIIWTGKLLDAHFDEFGFRGALVETLPTGSKLYVPVVQDCERGQNRWIEIPAEGKSSRDYKEPAPFITIKPKS